MKSVINRLYQGIRHFGSGGQNSKEFHDFAADFKKALSYQLRKLGAKEITMSKGHFYLSGFFKIAEQYYYYSIPDVRHEWSFNRAGEPEIMIRTAEHTKDYTGGQNNFFTIENGMYKAIARRFRIELPEPKEPKNKWQEAIDIAQSIAEKGYVDMYTGSAKKAYTIAFRLNDIVDPKNTLTVIGARYGRMLSYYKGESDKMKFYYNAGTKRATYEVLKEEEEISDEEFLKRLRLDIRKEGEVVANMFVPEQRVFLEPEAVALHDFIKGAEVTRHPDFDRALGIFRERYPDAYMELLD